MKSAKKMATKKDLMNMKKEDLKQDAKMMKSMKKKMKKKKMKKKY